MSPSFDLEANRKLIDKLTASLPELNSKHMDDFDALAAHAAKMETMPGASETDKLATTLAAPVSLIPFLIRVIRLHAARIDELEKRIEDNKIRFT